MTIADLIETLEADILSARESIATCEKQLAEIEQEIERYRERLNTSEGSLALLEGWREMYAPPRCWGAGA